MTHFTLLVAVYNAQDYLAATLDSLLNQTFGDFQVICIDDCSTDHSAQILEDYAARDSRILLLRTPENSGQAVARNLGLERAEGLWTLMVDADDLLAPDALEKLQRTMLAHPDADAILLDLVKFWEDGREERWQYPEGRTLFTGREACTLAVEWQLHGYYAVRTDIHRRLPYDASCRVYSDDNTVRLHFLYSRKVAVSEGVYLYRQHAASVTHVFNLRRLDFVRANCSLRRLLEEHHADEAALLSCEKHCWGIFVGIYREMYRHRHEFSDHEMKEIHHTLSWALQQMRPSRLPLSMKLHPSTLFLRPYGLFRCWQKVLLQLKTRS